MNRALRELAKSAIPRSLLIRRLDSSAGNSVLLTFDDGPHEQVTPAVLERLTAYEARAVFFVVGKRAEAVQSALRLAHERGHEIGNHSYDHPNAGTLPFFTYKRDLMRCQSLIKRCTGQAPRLFRPPRGQLSVKSLLWPRICGLKTVNWSLGVGDWACRGRDQALAAAGEIDRRVTPGDILLLHDDNSCVLDILDHVLPRLRSRGIDLQSGLEHL